MTNEYMKRCSKPYAVREMKLKTTVSYFTLIRVATIKETNNNNC